MTINTQPSTRAAELANKNAARFPNESAEYRTARTALLAEEIEPRRHIEPVAQQRRALPPGGVLPKPYAFIGENGPVAFADLFGDKQTLAVYSYMFGSNRERPCPMCTSLLSAWDGEALDVEQNIALVAVARSSIERLVAFKNEHGWLYRKVYSDVSGDYTRDYVDADDADIPAFHVFTRRTGFDAVVDDIGQHARRPRGQVVPKAQLFKVVTPSTAESCTPSV